MAVAVAEGAEMMAPVAEDAVGGLSTPSTNQASQNHGDMNTTYQGAQNVNPRGMTGQKRPKSNQPSLEGGNPDFNPHISTVMAKTSDPLSAGIAASASEFNAGVAGVTSMVNQAQRTKQTQIKADATKRVAAYQAQGNTASAAYANQGGVSNTSSALGNKLELGNLFNQTDNVFSGNEFNSILGGYFQNKTGGFNVNI